MKLPLSVGNKLQYFHDSVHPVMTLEGQTFTPLEKKTKSHQTAAATGVLHGRVYLWSFQNHITNPTTQLYNKMYFVSLDVLHNVPSVRGV